MWDQIAADFCLTCGCKEAGDRTVTVLHYMHVRRDALLGISAVKHMKIYMTCHFMEFISTASKVAKFPSCWNKAKFANNFNVSRVTSNEIYPLPLTKAVFSSSAISVGVPHWKSCLGHEWLFQSEGPSTEIFDMGRICEALFVNELHNYHYLASLGRNNFQGWDVNLTSLALQSFPVEIELYHPCALPLVAVAMSTGNRTGNS